MQEKSIFKISSSSYSQFLPPTKQHFPHLTKPHDISIDSEFFKRSVSLHYHQIYTSNKWLSQFYRFIFFGFALLFLGLGIAIFFKTTNYAFGFYFGKYEHIKNYISLFCLFLTGISCVFGYKIHPEKEASQYLVRKIEKELNGPNSHLPFECDALVTHVSKKWLTPHQILWIKKVFIHNDSNTH